MSVGAWFWYTFDRPGRWSAEAISLVAPENLEIRKFDLEPTDGAEPAVLGDTNCESSQFLLWGDSHGMSLSPALDALGKEYGVRGLQITRSATAPLVEWCYNPRVQKPDESPSFKKRWSDLVMNTIREEKIRHVFLVARWSNYENEDFARQLIQTLEEIRSLDSSISVYVVSDVPCAFHKCAYRVAAAVYAGVGIFAVLPGGGGFGGAAVSLARVS